MEALLKDFLFSTKSDHFSKIGPNLTRESLSVHGGFGKSRSTLGSTVLLYLSLLRKPQQPKFKRRENEMQLPTLLCIKVQSLKMQLYMGFCYIPPKHWDYFWGQQKIMSQNSRQGRKRCRLSKFFLCKCRVNMNFKL